MDAPKAAHIPHPHSLHGDERADDYYWLRNRENPEVINYLEAENAYYEEVMRPLEPLTDRLYQEMVARIPDDESNVPVRLEPYYYYSRIDKSLQYPVYARKKADRREQLADTPEQVVLDLNTLAQDGGYLSVTEQRISPNQQHLAYLENRDGTDRYTVHVKDLDTGALLSDRIPDVFIYESVEWDATGEYLFYVTVDDSQRPYRLWRHRVGAANQDELLYEEPDITFSLRLNKSRSGQYLFLKSESKTISEVRYLNANDPLSTMQVLDSRRRDIAYDVEHWGSDFLILTNEDAVNFRLMRCPVEEPGIRTDLVPYDDSRYLQGIHPFQHALLLSGRQNGLTEVWVYENGTLTPVQWDETVYTVSLSENHSYDTTEVIVSYESLVTPRTMFAIDLITGAKEKLHEVPVPGNYNKADYHQERLWATASDGTQIPMVAVYHRDALKNGPAPLILYGYGSYGINIDPKFSNIRLPLLDLGVVYVIAQVRGGSEMGYSWYLDGKLLNKRNTFTDFVSAAEDLIGRGYTTSDLLAAQGRSAGGLLMGAVANLGGHLFKVMMPGVPFVDVVTTMLDATIPLTSLEWDEWGNPEDEDYYWYMKSYSPYDEVEKKWYPHMLVTTGLNDPRVAYWEPAKWVARLREFKTDDNTLLLKTNMGAGHFGASGRFAHLKELAAEYAFLLDKLGVKAE